MRLTLSKWGFGSPSWLLKFQSSITGVKTPRMGAFFILLESYWSADVENGLAWTIWTSAAQVMAKRRAQFDSRLLKVGNRLDPGACRSSATHRWKALEERYKFALDLISIGGLSKELWLCKAPRVQTGTISRLLLGSPGTKSHSDVGAMERHRIYYMGEGGGFPWVRAMVNQVSLKLPVVCLNTKGAPKGELTNLLVGLMQVRVSE